MKESTIKSSIYTKPTLSRPSSTFLILLAFICILSLGIIGCGIIPLFWSQASTLTSHVIAAQPHTTAPNGYVAKEKDNIRFFSVAILGSLIMYFVLYRETKIYRFLGNPSANWPLFAIDFLGYIVLGSFVVVFLIAPASTREAFMAGLSWESIVAGLGKGTQSHIDTTLKEKE